VRDHRVGALHRRLYPAHTDRLARVVALNDLDVLTALDGIDYPATDVEQALQSGPRL
jgi:hypothetical protein